MTEIITNSNPVEVVLTTMPIEVVTNGVVYISTVLDDWENIQGKPETFPPSPHTQGIESITGLVEALGGKEPADPTILKQSAIGQTVQPYDADTNTFTIDEKSKLASLNSTDYATAAQGTKADNSVQLTGDQTVAGTKTFTSPLILPNNSRINGVEHFYQATKPLTRVDGSPLVIGDRWYKINDGTERFWNGTYWEGQTFLLANSATSFNGTGSYKFTPFPQRTEFVLLKTAIYTGYFNTAQTLTNYFKLAIGSSRGSFVDYSGSVWFSYDHPNSSTPTNLFAVLPLNNYAINLSQVPGDASLAFYTTRFGSPGTSFCSIGLEVAYAL